MAIPRYRVRKAPNSCVTLCILLVNESSKNREAGLPAEIIRSSSEDKTDLMHTPALNKTPSLPFIRFLREYPGTC